MQFPLGISVQVPDIAQALEDTHGTFVALINGQNFLAVSEEGHSLTILRPFGPPVNLMNTPTSGQTFCWLTKISSKNIAGEYSFVTTGEFSRATRTATG